MHTISEITDFFRMLIKQHKENKLGRMYTFYFTMMKKGCKCPKMLNNGVQDLCNVMKFNYFKILTSFESFENYIKYFKSQFLGKVRNNCNGTIDSIRLVPKCER